MKKLLKILILFVAVFLVTLAFENHTQIEIINDCQESLSNLDSLHLSCPIEVAEFISIAMQFYPELVNTEIKVRFIDQRIAHTARPKFSSILNPISKRKYNINISRDLSYPIQGSLFHNLPDSAKIGVLTHELAHIVDYESRSSFGLLFLGLGYLVSDDLVKNYERNIDRHVVKRCAGNYLKSWSKSVSQIFELDGRSGRYLSPVEIDSLMRNKR